MNFYQFELKNLNSNRPKKNFGLFELTANLDEFELNIRIEKAKFELDSNRQRLISVDHVQLVFRAGSAVSQWSLSMRISAPDPEGFATPFVNPRICA